jgi:hypothetical protein
VPYHQKTNKVIEGRQKSTEQQSQGQGRATGIRQISVIGIDDGQSTIDRNTQHGATTIATNMDQAVLQGALQGSVAVGEKCSNTDTAGSYMSRRRTSKVVTSKRSNQHVISQVKKYCNIMTILKSLVAFVN